MEREIGYYWVWKEKDTFSNKEVALWNGQYWERMGTNKVYYDYHFYKIGNRIINDNID